MKNIRSYKNLSFTLFLCLVFLYGQMAFASDKDGKHFMWEVSSDKGKVYLLGSIHLAKKDLYPLPAVIDSAFNSSNALAVEMDVKNVNPADVLKYAFYQDTNTLKSNIKPEIYEKLGKMFAKYNIPETYYRKFKPWFAVISVTSLELVSTGYEEQYGIDIHFINEAKKQKKKVLELESFEEQMNMLDKDMQPYQDMFINYSLLDLDSTSEQVDSMFVAWKSGDTTMMGRLANSEVDKYPEFKPITEIMVDKRNVRMTAKIEKWMEEGGTYFVIAGAAHMIGENGIINLLKKTGRYRVEQK
jgi:uncharacterized protein YbaP (TraB family)